jgi:hypothetical protein
MEFDAKSPDGPMPTRNNATLRRCPFSAAESRDFHPERLRDALKCHGIHIAQHSTEGLDKVTK